MAYPTDLTDAQWAMLEPDLAQVDGPGRPRTVDMRQIVNALLYKNRTGCQWRMLPSDFPQRGIVRYYFDKWTHDGTWERVNDRLRQKARIQLGRDPEPSIAVIDSQSVCAVSRGGCIPSA